MPKGAGSRRRGDLMPERDCRVAPLLAMTAGGVAITKTCQRSQITIVGIFLTGPPSVSYYIIVTMICQENIYALPLFPCNCYHESSPRHHALSPTQARAAQLL